MEHLYQILILSTEADTRDPALPGTPDSVGTRRAAGRHLGRTRGLGNSHRRRHATQGGRRPFTQARLVAAHRDRWCVGVLASEQKRHLNHLYR